MKGSLFYCLHRLYRCNSYSLQNESLYLMLIHPVWFTANGLRVLKSILYKQLIISYSVHIHVVLKKGRRGAYMKIIFLASELMHLLWTNQQSKQTILFQYSIWIWSAVSAILNSFITNIFFFNTCIKHYSYHSFKSTTKFVSMFWYNLVEANKVGSCSRQP